MTPDTRKSEDIVLVHPDEISLIEAGEARQRKAKTVARFRLLWERRSFLGKVLLWGAVASLALAYLIPVRYESTAQLMPPDQPASELAGLVGAISGGSGSGGSDSGGSGTLGSLAGIAGDVLGVKTSSDLFIGILQSRTVQDDLINKFDLRKVYWTRRMADARKELDRNTTLGADRKSGIITIKITDHSPQRAAAMGREYVQQLNLMLINLNTSAAHRERVFLEERLKQVKQDLEVSEKRLSEFSSKNLTLDMKAESVAMVESAAALEGQLIAAQTEVEGLRQVYSDGNVRVRSVEARIDELKRQIQKVGGKPETAGDASGPSADSLYPTIRELPLLGVNYADLYREMTIQEVTFEMLTKQFELAKLEEAKELPSVKVLDEPDISERKSYPPRLLILCMGVLLALAFGIVFIIGTDNWRSIDPQDPGKVLAIEVWDQVKEKRPLVWNNGSGSGDFRSGGSDHGKARRG